MENLEQTITVKDVKILETVEDIQERRDQVKQEISRVLLKGPFILLDTLGRVVKMAHDINLFSKLWLVIRSKKSFPDRIIGVDL